MESSLEGLVNRGPSLVDYENILQLMTTSGTNCEHVMNFANKEKAGKVSEKMIFLCRIVLIH